MHSQPDLRIDTGISNNPGDLELSPNGCSSFTSFDSSLPLALNTLHRRQSLTSCPSQYSTEPSSQLTTGPTTPISTRDGGSFSSQHIQLQITDSTMYEHFVAPSYDPHMAFHQGDMMTRIPGPPAGKQFQDFFYPMAGPDLMHAQTHPPEHLPMLHPGLPIHFDPPVLPSNARPPPSAFSEASPFLAPPAYASADHGYDATRTVALAELDGAATGLHGASPRRDLGEPFTTPVKAESTWHMPSSSPAAPWSGRSSSNTPHSMVASPPSPSPAARRPQRCRTRAAAPQSFTLPSHSLSSPVAFSPLPNDHRATSEDESPPDGAAPERVRAALSSKAKNLSVPYKTENSGGFVCTKLRKHDTGEIKECGRKFKRQEHLNRHAQCRLHSNRLPHQCRFCGSEFDRSDNCHAHVERHFNPAAKSRVNKKTKGPYTRRDAEAADYLGLYEAYVRKEEERRRLDALGAEARAAARADPAARVPRKRTRTARARATAATMTASVGCAAEVVTRASRRVVKSET